MFFGISNKIIALNCQSCRQVSDLFCESIKKIPRELRLGELYHLRIICVDQLAQIYARSPQYNAGVDDRF